MYNKIKKIISSDQQLYILILVFIAIIVCLSILIGPTIYSVYNIKSILYQIPEFGFLAIAMMLAMICGGIDLSIVSNANTVGIFAALILTKNWFSTLTDPVSLVVALLIALITSIIFGAINGILIAKFSVPPILATLGSMIFYSGIGLALTSGKSVVGLPTIFTNIGINTIIGIPIIFIIFIIFLIIIALILSYTSYGIKVYLYGENNIALRFSAVDNEKLIIFIYSIIGLLSGISGLIIISRVNSAKVGYGDAYLLQTLLVCVIGGINPDGGKGKAIGVFIAILCIQFLGSAFTFWQFSPYTRKLVWGSMLILIMALNYFINKYQEIKRLKKMNSEE